MKRKFLILFSAFIAFLCLNNTFAQTINLGTAADFVLFTTNGAITNTGITHLTGHVGSNVGGSTGFGNVDGVMHDQDPASAAATVDLNLAYLQLDAAVATFFPGISLGAGQTLNAGVYSIPGAATLNGTLFLDAQSDPTAVFIIQVEGTLGIGSGAQVVLLNGAQACNVYWKIEGQVSLAANVTMRGTIVANNAAISMNAGDSLEGRALSINGAIGVNALVAYTPLGCLAPILMGPGNPIMGTTECFALFSGIGPVTNSGITTASGDVGTNSGLTTGFNPLFVTGTIHPVPDGATAQCATDFTVIYNNLTALPYDIELLYPAQFGNNLVLTPHVYLMNGAVSFTNNVYLNAQGNADAVFVIQINGAFGTSTFSNVILQNGTQAKNVYWVINGATSISDFSIFNGTLISQGAIDLLTGVTMNGRALTGVGAISTFAVDVIMPSSCAPFTIIEPSDTIACDGQAATFTVVADGIGLSYQWRKGNVDLVNGGNISGVNTPTLTINPASILDQALDYNVVITGSFVPNDTSNFVSLTIVPAPVITSEPINVTACEGDSISFGVLVSGAGVTYQWRKGNVDLVNGGSISGATSDTLTINPTTLSDAGNDYYVVISGGCSPNDTSIQVSLILNQAPLITSEPINVTACEGDSISFGVLASGTGVTYQWRKGNVDLVNGGSISGATSDTLTINPTTLSDAGNDYYVVISGGCSPNDTSIQVSLILNQAPLITSEPINITACIGDSISFGVLASGTGVTYQWRKGNVDLVNGGSISGATSDTLTINPTTLSDAGNDYYVIISGGCSSNDTSIQVSLILNQAPLITSEPINITACEGDSISFGVLTSGTGVTYQWRKGNVDLVNGGSISGATSDTLTINPTTLSDAGNDYYVIISGGCSPNDTSIQVSLILNQAPLITSEPINVTVCEGESASFSVTATGTGLTYQWQKGAVDLVNGGSIAGATTATLSINPTTASDAGSDYTVVITGTCFPSVTSVNVTLTLTNCSADLSVVKTASSLNPIIGETVVFTIVASNLSPFDATGVVVSELLQSGYSYTSSSTTTGVYDPISGNWTIGNLSAGGSETLTITAEVLSSGSYDNTATITGLEPETDLNNNSSTVIPVPSDFFIPEGFSPNGDMVNDLFIIRGIFNFPSNSITIYNRWGNEVFSANPYQNTWDGKSTSTVNVGGDVWPVGTYFYVLDLGDGSKPIKGTIFLNN